MKSSAALRVVENNSFASKNFTIQASGKMFHMVISGLYSNKPQSITRELWSNAFDAHAMSGKEDVPFEVTYPTAMTPTFSCRDFGEGIAHEDMEALYTVLGHSSKEDTNKAVGKWGVGRMSPMSYTDTFSVVSRHKGMITYYSVQLGPDGSPQLHVLAPPTPTTEHSGLEVSFPVKREDIHAFQSAANIVAFGFDVKPVVTNANKQEHNGREATFEPIKKVFEGEGYYLHNDHRLNSSVYAQMGCVLYPIPYEHQSNFRHSGIVYKFDIGDLEVTASREALSFGPNDPTLASLKAKYAQVERNIKAAFDKEVEAQPTLFYASRRAAELSGFALSLKDFHWRGKDLSDTLAVWEIEPPEGLGVSCGFLRPQDKNVSKVNGSLRFRIQEKQVIYVQDTSDKKANARAARRIAKSLRELNNQYYIWVRANLKDKKQEKSLNELVNSYDFPVIYVKDLPDEGAISTGPRGKIKVSRLINSDLQAWDMDDATFKAGGYYVQTVNGICPALVRKLETYIKQFMGVSNIVMVPKSISKRFEDDKSNWKPLYPALEASVRLIAATVKEELDNQHGLLHYKSYGYFADTGGAIGDFAKRVNAYQEKKPFGVSYYIWGSVFRDLNLPQINDEKLDEEFENILDKYPLLKLYSSGSYVKEFKDYINLIHQRNDNT